MSEAPAGARGARTDRGAWLALLLVLCGAAAVRWRLLDVPLERDEGEYAYAGELLLDGVPPYAQAYNMKLPGIYAAYAGVLAVFGPTARGIHQGLIVVNALTAVLLFLLARRLFGAWTGVAAAAGFATLSLGPAVNGPWANAEHFVLPFALGGFLVLTGGGAPGYGRGLGRAAAAGALFGCAFLVKQHGAFFGVAGGIALVLGDLRHGARRTASRAALFALACAVPWGATCLALLAAGVFDTFWFWTVSYARAYTAQVPRDLIAATFRLGFGPIFASAWPLWCLGGLGAIALAASPVLRARWRVTVPFLALSCLAVTPGFFFRPHYFLLALPAAALGFALAARAAFDLLHGRIGRRGALAAAALLVAGPVAQALVHDRRELFELTPAQLARRTYGANPFPEAVEVARLVQALTQPEDRVAVIGSEPQIYFYARRRSATGYVYTYALMEDHRYNLRMQEEMIGEIEAADPPVVVFVNVPTSWLGGAWSPRRFLDWWAGYSRRFELVGLVEIRPEGPRFRQGPELAGMGALPPNSLGVYRRR